MELRSKKIEYNLRQEQEYGDITDNQKQATISFVRKEDDSKGWQFFQCNFEGLNKVYSKKDWEFLGKLAEKIKELNKELNNT